MRAIRSRLRTPAIRALSLLAICFIGLGVFTGLLVRHLNGREAALAEGSMACDQFIAAETALRQNIAAARVGLVQDYDRTVWLSAETERAAARMQASLTPLLPDQADRLEMVASRVTEQLDMVERFKSHNAVLRNALAAFGFLSARFDVAFPQAGEESIVRRLGMAILELTLNTTPGVVSQVDEQIRAIAPLVSSDPESLSALLRHAQIIRDGLPIMDATLRFLMSVPDDADLQALRDAVLARQATAQAVGRDYRYILSGTSGVLVLLLVRLILALRVRARALRRRAELEWSLADFSARLSEPIGTGARRQISEALAMLAEATGADRACAMLEPGLEGIYLWPSHGAQGCSRWAWDIDAFMQLQAGPEVMLLHIDKALRGRSRPERALLESTGLYGLAAARRAGMGILAVGWSDATAGMAKPETPVLKVALELLIHAQHQLHLAQDHARLEVSLRKAKRMETLGAFASGIAHNFNNILAAMIGYAELEELVRRERGETAPNLEALRAAGQRGQDLVGSILAFGRRELVGPQMLDGQAILIETVTLLRATWPPEVALSFDDSGAPMPIVGSGTQLQQVLLNLCRNAAQAITGAGEVRVSLAAVELGSRTSLSHGTLPPGRYALFKVCDTGSGIDRETLDQVFEPFFSARVGGNGLGLATAWAIVRDHDGCWNVSSTPGEGSVFEFWLPVEHPRPVPKIVAAGPAPTGHGEAVLLINPNRPALLRDEDVIAALGFEPAGFDDPAAAIAACGSDPGRFGAIVIVGARLPLELARLVGSLRACAPTVPILLAVGASADIDLDALSVAGLSDIVAYGSSFGNLSRALATWVASRQSVAALPTN